MESSAYCPNGYKDEHTFPSGLQIQFESMISDDYRSELNQVDSIENIGLFLERWKYLFPSLAPLKAKDFDLEKFKNFVTSIPYQEEHCKDEDIQKYMNILLPYEMIMYWQIADHYGAPFGVAILQCWNAGLINEKDGYWNFEGDKK